MTAMAFGYRVRRSIGTRGANGLGDVFFRYPLNHATNANVRTRRATLRAVAGYHASSLPAPSGERADRARMPRKPASLALAPMSWQRV